MAFHTKRTASFIRVYAAQRSCKACAHRLYRIGEQDIRGHRISRCDAFSHQPPTRETRKGACGGELFKSVIPEFEERKRNGP